MKLSLTTTLIAAGLVAAISDRGPASGIPPLWGQDEAVVYAEIVLVARTSSHWYRVRLAVKAVIAGRYDMAPRRSQTPTWG